MNSPGKLLAAAAAAASQLQQQQQQPALLGGMLQGWPAAALAPDSLLPAAAVVLETVRPDPAAAPEVDEYRLGVALLPLRLRLNQDLVAFLVAFFGSVSEAVAAVENPLTAAMAAAAAAAAANTTAAAASGEASSAAADSGSEASPQQQQQQQLAPVSVQPLFFQKVVIWGSGVCIDYRPRRIDVAALREGDFLELLNLVPWGGVDLSLKPLKFAGVLGWEGLAAAAASDWMRDIARSQAHKFLVGVAPIRSVVKVGGAVAALLAGPAAALQGAVGGAVAAAGRSAAGMAAGSSSSSSGGMQQRLRAAAAAVAAASKAAAAANRGAAAAAAAGSSTRRFARTAAGGGSSSASLHAAMRESSASFARALLYEALGLGAGVAAGAEVVLAGGALVPLPADTPAGLIEGLRAAAGEVQGGFVDAAEVLVRGLGPSVRGWRAGSVEPWQVARGVMRVAPAAAAAPAKGLAAAAKTALLGAQNALGAAQLQGPQHQQQQQQQSQEDEEEEEEEEEEGKEEEPKQQRQQVQQRRQRHEHAD
jgi:autophagy-related protein 2